MAVGLLISLGSTSVQNYATTNLQDLQIEVRALHLNSTSPKAAKMTLADASDDFLPKSLQTQHLDSFIIWETSQDPNLL